MPGDRVSSPPIQPDAKLTVTEVPDAEAGSHWDSSSHLVEVFMALSEDEPVVIVTAKIDTEKNRLDRAAWGLFRDRRPELYGVLLTKDGRNPQRNSSR